MDSSLGNRANFTQNIHFTGSESDYSAEIIAQDVTVNCYPGSHKDGSSKVKLTNLVDYQWESKYYKGQLIAIHIAGKTIAYGIKGKGNGMIRVTNPETNHRSLIKDLKGLVQDIAFALVPTQIILACMDEDGSVFIYNIDNSPKTLSCELSLHIIHPNSIYGPKTNYRVIWCPYVPSFEDEMDATEEAGKLLVCLNGNKAEVWDIHILTSKYGAGPLFSDKKYEGYVEIDDHKLDVIDASLSPDGTAIATAGLDGYVKFFQVQTCTVEGDKLKCLHQWQPHNGKPLSSLFFLDNVNENGSDSKFWKFAITGANNNSEIKVWSCESWTCLQLIHFKPSPNSTIPDLFFKARLDLTANYLLMSDVNNRILYVLQLQKNDADRLAAVSCISEFLLPSPFLSFCIVSASIGEVKFINSSEEYDQDDIDGEDYDEDRNVTAVSIKLYVVQPKSLQICNITFEPANSLENNYTNFLDVTGTTPLEANRLEARPEEKEIPNLEDLQSSVTLLIQQQQQQQNNQILQHQPALNLMSPADFTSPVVTASPNSNGVKKEVGSPLSTDKMENLIDFQQPQKDNFASGGSSPSREVQEILSLKNSQEYFDNLVKLESDDTEVLKPNFNATEEKLDVVWPNIPMMKPVLEQKDDVDETDDVEGNHDAAALNFKIASLEQKLQEQNELLRLLIQEQKAVRPDEVKNLVGTEAELVLSKYQTQMTKFFENFLKEQKRKEREFYEHFVTSVAQNVSKRIGDSLQGLVVREVTSVLQPTVNSEIKNVVLPAVLATFDKLHLQLDMHYSQKLNTIDQLLKSNIGKLVSSKTVSDSLSASVVSIVKPSLEQCYKDMITSTLVPSWERICTAMFQQIHTTFTQGTKEYMSSVESYMDRQRKVQDKSKDLVAQMSAISDTMKNNVERLNVNLGHEMQRQLSSSFNSLEEKLIQNVSDQVKEQVKVGFKAQAALLEDSVANAVRSRAVTPSPHTMDAQIYAQLDLLLASGNIEGAFQQALSASSSVHDVRFVLHVCEQTNPSDVFTPTQGKGDSVLPQNVLLSLIQQLSTDLTRKTDIKLKYLQEALLTLETDNPLTKQHMPTVLSSLLAQINHFIMTNPTHKNVKNMRLLQMATQSLLIA